MNHPTTIRAALEDFYDNAFLETQEEGHLEKSLETALQDITRIVEDAKPKGKIISYIKEDGTGRADMEDVRKLLQEYESNLRKVLK